MLTLATLLTAAALVLPPNVEQIDSAGGFTLFRLKSNDMTILVSPNHAAPVFTFFVVYHVGSRNEAPGNTGSAHLLEHLIFNKSTENFGKARGHKTFQEILYEAGADFSSTNMTTWNDRMTGYSTLPADKLELAMRIEADRLRRGLILDEERRPEMSVVRNEYEIGENDPWSALNKAVNGAAIVAHPYHWDTIGYRSDIENVTTEKLREHYDTYFWPDNAAAILVGDFDVEEALKTFDAQFGGFPKAPKPIPQVTTVEPPQEGERRVVVKRPGSVGMVHIAYMRPGSLDPDFIPLDVLSTIIGDGLNARLYQSLVEPGLATAPFSWNQAFKDPYLIYFGATVADGTDHQAVETAIKEALARVAKDGVTEEELARAKKQIEVAVIRSRDGTYNLASSMAEAVASADWKWFVTYLDRMNAVTADDVNRVAARYLVPDHATVGWFVPVDAPVNPPVEQAAAVVTPAPAPIPAPATPSAPPAAPGEAAFAARTLHRVLPNGITLDVVANGAVPTVALHGTILAGDMTAPAGNPAIADLTARMLGRGTKSRTKLEIGALLENAGARLSMGTSTTEFTITGNGLSRDLPLLLDILADELLNPSFPDSELAKAKLEMKNGILQSSESTRSRAYDRLTQLTLPAGHPFRAPTKEQWLAGIDAATVEDLKAFHRERIVGASLFLAVVGDVDREATAALVARHLGALPAGARPVFPEARVEPAKLGKGTREIVLLPGKANIDFVFGHASGLRRTDPDYEAALIANAALGQTSLSSRIGKRVRDTEGLSYNLWSRFRQADVLDGVWLTDVAVAPQNLAQAVRSTREEIEKYCREGITADEVEAQKSFFAGNYNVRLGTNAGVAAALTDAARFGYGPAYLDEFPARMRAVTKVQVDAAIRKFFHPARMHLIVAGDVKKLP